MTSKLDIEKIIDTDVDFCKSCATKEPLKCTAGKWQRASSTIKPPYYKVGDKQLHEIIADMIATKKPKYGFNFGNAMKYLVRFDKKNGIEDLEKSKECIDMLIVQKKADDIANDDDIRM